MKYIALMSFLIISSSCSLFKSEETNEEKVLKSLNVLEDKEYFHQMNSLGEIYINSPNIRPIQLSQSATNYLNNLYNKILVNNQLLFDSSIKPKFHFIKSSTPFYFSLPNAQFFFSTGLLSKYLKNEELLVGALVFEFVKSQKNLYRRSRIVPVGFFSTERMLLITNISHEVKTEIYKWSFHVMRRSGHDGFAILNWIQTQNRNILDFSLQFQGASNPSKEEFNFKNFLIRMKKEDVKTKRAYNSSPGFYRLMEDIKRGRI